MNRDSIVQSIPTISVSRWAGGLALAGLMLVGLTASAQERGDQGPEGGDHPQKQCQKDRGPDGDRADRDGHHDSQRSGHPEGPPPRHDGYGPPPHRDGNGRPDGPPPRRGEFGAENSDRAYGPPPRREDQRYARRDEAGHRPPPPPPRRHEDDHGGYVEKGGEGHRPEHRGGPGQPPGPPAFEDIDANGDGSISGAEYKAFREQHRPGPRPDAPRRPEGPPPAE